LSKLDGAIPRALKPSEIANKQAKLEQMLRKLERKQQQALTLTEAAGQMSAAKQSELAEMQAQMEDLRSEQSSLERMAVTFSNEDLKRTPLPKVLTPVIMNHRYACEFDLKVDIAEFRSAGDDIRKNAVEVGILLCATALL
jgi:predicted nuclease with TOPRIM domain